MQERKYPIGKQDFPKIINENFVYVDKTKFAYELAVIGGSNFLSKPRRFGKSLFLSTLESIFLGKKELFKGLYIYDKWVFEEYPIIRIDYTKIGYRELGLDEALRKEMNSIFKFYGLKSTENSNSQKFRELIVSLEKKYNKGVVILIDEYDKPLIDYLDEESIDQAKTNREILKSFYSVLKPLDAYIKLLFITGVSKFSKVSIFSDLNNLTDLSLDPSYNEICGISQKELEANFTEELTLYDKEKVKKWYNGYKWDVDGDTVYNPFSILTFFKNKGKYQNYWYTTGTPSFLMKMCRIQHLYNFEEITINQDDLGNFDIENLKIEPILFQTGYLTIVGENSLFRNYKLSFPNIEVKESYLRNLLEAYIDSKRLTSSTILEKLLESLTKKNKDLLKESINLAFSHIPYSLWQKENEQYYHALVHLLFSLLGVYIFSEVQSQHGRSDALVIYEDEIYCLEFKLNQSATEAINQIENKGYFDRFKDSGKTINQIGINFSSEKKAVDDIIWK